MGGILFMLATECAAQWLTLGEWGGTYESLIDYARQDTVTRNSQPNRFQNVLSENKIFLRNSGASIYDPRLITFSLGGTFGLSQNWLMEDSGTQSRQGTLWGYDFLANILPEKDLSLDLFADRNQSVFSGALAGRIDVITENRGARLLSRRLYIPSTLTFRQELQDEESQSGGAVSRRRDRRNILTYEGQRGWIDGEMSLQYELVDFVDQISPALNYKSHEGTVSNNLDFGAELNRHWSSRLHFFARSGVANLTNLNADEFLRIDHTERLETQYRYSLNRIETTGGASTANLASFTLRHRLYESLMTNLGLDANFQKLPGGERDTYGGLLDFDYTKRLPAEGRLDIRLGGQLHYDSNRFRGTESFVPQESHGVATPFALAIPLNNPFVIVASIVVTKIAFGPLPIGCIAPVGPPTLLLLGRDYTVQAIGDITEIQPQPCTATAPGINPGDTIAVDYRFSVSPSLSYTTNTWHLNMGLDYRWIRPYFIHEQTNQTLLSGRDGRFLDNQRSDTFGTELRYEGQRLRASLLGEYRIFASDRVSYNSVRSNQFLGWAILPDLNLTLTASEALSNYSRPSSRETRLLNSRATVSYRWDADIFSDAFIGMGIFDDTLTLRERTAEAGLRVRWLYRRVEILPSLEFHDRRRGDTDTRDFRAMLRIIRRF